MTILDLQTRPAHSETLTMIEALGKLIRDAVDYDGRARDLENLRKVYVLHRAGDIRWTEFLALWIEETPSLRCATAARQILGYREQPKPEPQKALPTVPAGRYALRTDGVVKFYVLDRPETGRWAGYVFLNAQASDEKYPIKNPTTKNEILRRIAEDIEGSQMLYGVELGRCYRCGRTLTDETSRALGIGPDCRTKR